MSIRRINSTGRRKILREDARIFVRPDSDGDANVRRDTRPDRLRSAQ